MNVRNIFYVETTMSDHSMMTLYFNTDVSEKGPGTWIVIERKLIESIDKEKECNLYNTSILVWCDNLKYKIKKLSRNYSQTRVKKRKTGVL